MLRVHCRPGTRATDHRQGDLTFVMSDPEHGTIFETASSAVKAPELILVANAPANNAPAFDQVQGWSTAAWSDGRMSYLLATQAGPDALKQLL